MAQALVQNLFVEGFRGGANTDIVGTFQIQVVNEGGDPADISEATGSSFTAKKAMRRLIPSSTSMQTTASSLMQTPA